MSTDYAIATSGIADLMEAQLTNPLVQPGYP